jgi:hypothetical protein
MDRRIRRNGEQLMAYFTLVGGVLILLFWIFYSSGVLIMDESDNPLIGGFESAFPFADAVLGILLVLSGLNLLRRKVSGTYFLIASASMTLYLGILDVTFYGRHGLYVPLNTASLAALFINSICIGGGLIGLWFGWKLWRKQCKTISV